MDPLNGLVPGRIVYFVFNAAGIAQVQDARAGQPVTLVGNPPLLDTVYPAMVVWVWLDEGSRSRGSVNLKVMLDGADTFWAPSVPFDPDKRPWSWHWMFEGQNTRYTPDRTA